jgi:hypothetical protein
MRYFRMVETDQLGTVLYFENKLPFRLISPTIEGMLLRLHTSHFKRTRYKLCTFGINRLIRKGCLFEHQSTFSSVSSLPLKGCN